MSRPYTFISSIITPAPDYDLAALATVKTILNITDTLSDAVLALLITRASVAIESYCSNPFVVETVQDQFFPGSDGWPWTVRYLTAPLQLKRWPLIAVNSVVETIGGVATALTEGTDFLADYERGQLARLATYGVEYATPPEPAYWRPDPVVVEYQAGYATLPADVVEAAELVVKDKYMSRTRDAMLRNENVFGVYSAGYFQSGANGGSAFSPEVQALLSMYREPVFA